MMDSDVCKARSLGDPAMLKRMARFYRTAKHLRASQVVARARLRAWRPAPQLGPAPPLRSVRAAWTDAVAHPLSMLGPDEFCFLNERHRIAAPGDWNHSEWPRLWLYNLHYFDDLNAESALGRAAWHSAWLERWIAENPPGVGSGWEPYPTSRRILNWIKSALSGRPLSPLALHSMAVQTRWLRGRIERHLGGNHLLANAVALLCAGAFFEGEEAQEWLASGQRLLSRELGEQILADGGHYERSPMYHALVLEDLLDTHNVAQCFALHIPSAWRADAQRMQQWLATLTHPDGDIAFFNDATLGVAATPAQLNLYGARLFGSTLPPPQGSVLMRASGYARLVHGPAMLFADCGALGPDHLPGHAHADTLSFELSLGPERVLVNSGVSVYTAGAERVRQRGTAAHNALVLADADSSEVWHAFRVGRRARILEVQLEEAPEAHWLRAAHDGYRYLAGRNVHSRTWRLHADRVLIEDRVRGAPVAAVAHFHLHPQLAWQRIDDALVCVTASGRRLRWSFAGAKAIDAYESSWHPAFGRAVRAPALRITAGGDSLVTTIAWD